MNKQTKHYYKNICRKFPLMSKQEKIYLERLKQHLIRYEKKHPDITYDDYVAYFGEVDDIVASFYEHIESDYIIKRMKARKIIKYTSSFIIITSIILALLYVIILHKEYVSIQESKGNYYFEETIVEYE